MSSNDKYFDGVVASATTFLSRWAGGLAEMRELTVSHKSLIIVVRRADNKEKVLAVYCIDPEVIHGPVRWTDASLAVSRTELDECGETGFLVSDQAAGFRVRCGGIEVRELPSTSLR